MRTSLSATDSLRITTIVVAIVSAGLGMYSHRNSQWVRNIELNGMTYGGAYTICENEAEKEAVGKPCPDVAMEKFYAAMVVLCLMGSCVFSFAMKIKTKPMRLLDIAFHGLGSLVLLIAAILYIVSAVQIDNYRKGINNLLGSGYINILDIIELRFTAKIVAGAFTLVQALLYAVLAVQVVRQ